MFPFSEQLDSKHGMFIPTLIFSDVNEDLVIDMHF